MTHDNLGFLICDTARLLRKHFDNRVRTMGLTRAQWQVLKLVAREEGLHQAVLAERLELEPITLSRLLERMEKSGWVERRAVPGDKRARSVYLTEEAEPALKKLHVIGRGLLDDMLRGIPAELQKHLRQALLTMNENLTEMNSGKPTKLQAEVRI
jgi:DNA-binding MarR family transcriptional regulator